MKKIFFTLVFLFCIFGCSKNNPVTFENSEPLALAPDAKWAVVINPYAAFRESTDWASSVKKHCRKGEILLVKGCSVLPNEENWYLFDSGWLPESSVIIFSNRYKAETASRQYK